MSGKGLPMPIVKRIVCLANSRKGGGRCIAGREWDGVKAGAWIRPVSFGEFGELREHECRLQDGGIPDVLDIIDVPLREHRPHDYQSENWLVDLEYYWKRVGRLGWRSIEKFCEQEFDLWVEGSETSSKECYRIHEGEAKQLKRSLVLLKVPSIVIDVNTVDASGDRERKVRGQFLHKGKLFRFPVTDPVIEEAYLAKPDGRYELGECYLTISLGEPYKGFCYKLIAAIIDRARYETTTTPNPIFTIGHSNHPIERFIELLRQHGITAVADVRGNPYCRYARWFDRDELKRSLRASGIHYVFMGEELGGRPKDLCFYKNGRAQYDLIARTERFRHGIERLRRGALEHRIACMCAEKDPLDCHRTLLIGKELDALGLEVRHILADGTIETHDEAMKRLQQETESREPPLLRLAGASEKPEKIREALIAYKKKTTKVASRKMP